jgi:hypothetical protein
VIIRPAGKRRDVIRPAVLVDAGRARSLDDGTVHDLARLPKGLRVYVSWDDADALARAGTGELVAWGDEPIRWRLQRHGDSHRRNTDAVIIKQACDTHRQFDAGIAEWAEWLHGINVNPGWSLGGTSMNVLRATLDAPLACSMGSFYPDEKRPGFTVGGMKIPWTLGGRQQCFVEPGTVIHGAVQLDLPAAYTHVVGGLRYGGAWRKVEPKAAWQWHDAGFPVLGRGDVRIGSTPLAVGPLHRRPHRRPDSGVEEIAPSVPYPVEGRWQGLWTYAEIQQALAVGVHVRVKDAYVHAGGDTVFQDWHDAIMEGRALPGYAGQLAKATGNALWGQFVIDDRKRLQVQRWNGSYQALPVQSSGGHQKRAWDIGELVCGTVRAKLYEMLYGYGPDLVCCHTDGLWIRDVLGIAVPEPWRIKTDAAELHVLDLVCCHTDGLWIRDVLGIAVPEPWRIKTDAAELHVLDQQKYRYRTRRARTFTPVFSGVPAARAADTFQRLWGRFA